MKHRVPVSQIMTKDVVKLTTKNTLFDAAQEIDKKELGINYLFSYKVRTKTIAKLMGYSLKELMNMYPQIKNAQSVESQSAH